MEAFLSKLVGVPKYMTKRLDVFVEPIGAWGSTLGLAVKDNLLMIIKGMVNDTSVSMLVDFGATRSFVSEQLSTKPPLQFIGVYSSLELANGETIVSTGIALDVLLYIRKMVN